MSKVEPQTDNRSLEPSEAWKEAKEEEELEKVESFLEVIGRSCPCVFAF